MNENLAALDAASAPAPAPAGRVNLLGATQADLEALMSERGQRPYRSRQVFKWLFAHRASSFAAMTELPASLRAVLDADFELARPQVKRCQEARDGTRKYQFVAADGVAFEAVYIPEVGRGRKTNTLCISSQSGCAVGCKFCFTASLRRNRNLSAAEIVGQVLAVRDDVAPLGDVAQVSNIVFMGMGEPLLNYANVVQAARILLDQAGTNFSSRRVTISSSGIVPRLFDLGRDLPTQLAISLNATTDAVRTRIMPINKKWPLHELLAALRAYQLAPRRRITIEYVLLRGVNDTLEDARRLPKLLNGIPVKINLLPLNPHDQTVFEAPAPEQVAAFAQQLHQAGINACVRMTRGQDIAAACGQLGGTQ